MQRDSSSTREDSNDNPAFNVHKVIELFEKAALSDGNVDLQLYVDGYRELNKLFPLLGTLFSFVESDVSDKVHILQERLLGSDSKHYKTVEGMIRWECEQSISTHLDPPSGSRTLLRLHRALLFISRLLGNMSKVSGDDKLGPVARAAYDDTLAHHHGWLIRKGVHLAVRMLHTRRKFLRDLSNREDVDSPEVASVLAAFQRSLDTVYDRCQGAFVKHNCLDLP